MRYAISIFALFILLSCSSVAKKMYGIKDPAIETKESIYKYASSIRLDTSIVFTVDSTAYLQVFKRIQSSLPEAEIFSASGQNISYKNEQQDCNAGLFSFIPGLRKDSIYKEKDNFKLTTQIASLRDLSGNKVTDVSVKDYDYVLFIYWVKWIGKLNKDHVHKWVELASSNKQVRIKVFAINMDFQNWWNKSFQDRLISRMSVKK